jgi:predicted outer membrane protein
MSNRLLSALAVIAVLGLASCDGPPSTLNFIRKAEMSSLCEIEAGKIAIEKGHSAAVKQSASRWSRRTARSATPWRGL